MRSPWILKKQEDLDRQKVQEALHQSRGAEEYLGWHSAICTQAHQICTLARSGPDGWALGRSCRASGFSSGWGDLKGSVQGIHALKNEPSLITNWIFQERGWKEGSTWIKADRTNHWVAVRTNERIQEKPVRAPGEGETGHLHLSGNSPCVPRGECEWNMSYNCCFLRT